MTLVATTVFDSPDDFGRDNRFRFPGQPCRAREQTNAAHSLREGVARSVTDEGAPAILRPAQFFASASMSAAACFLTAANSGVVLLLSL
jgi:hypothetical protein